MSSAKRLPISGNDPGVCLASGEIVCDAKAARRFFARFQRQPAPKVVIDLRRAPCVNSGAWGVFSVGVRDAATNQHEVTIVARPALRRLIELSNLPRPVRMVFVEEQAA